jgi:4'-phosphopantetheinyl transferase EntD
MSASLLSAILPAAVAVAEVFGDQRDVILFPAEEALLQRAVERRRREFATARWCARAALAKLGLPSAAIGRDSRGAPRWPAGVVGSITHCPGYRAAAVARVQDVASIGIDGEPHRPLPSRVSAAIAVAEELGELAELAATDPAIRWDTLLFSAKESVYKAWFPLTGRSLRFADICVAIDPADGSFSVRLAASELTAGGRQPARLDGRWLVRSGLVVTSVLVPATSLDGQVSGRPIVISG